MKTWILVWFIMYPPAGPNQDVTWIEFQESNLTRVECFNLLVDKVNELDADEDVVGHEIYCKEKK